MHSSGQVTAKGKLWIGLHGARQCYQNHKAEVRVMLSHRSPLPAWESWGTLLRNLKVSTHGFSYVDIKRPVAGLCKGQPILEEQINTALSFWNSAAFLFSGRGSAVLADRGSSRTFLKTQINMIYDHSRHGLSEAAELRCFRGKHLHCAVLGEENQDSRLRWIRIQILT